MATVNVQLRDVTLRDGLQDESPSRPKPSSPCSTRSCAAGSHDIELTSFVRPDRVPAMADADALAARTADRDGAVARWGLVLNRRGAERAMAAGLRPPAVRGLRVRGPQPGTTPAAPSATPSASSAQIGRTARWRAAPGRGHAGHRVRLPLHGPVPRRRRAGARRARRRRGRRRRRLADTIGTAVADRGRRRRCAGRAPSPAPCPSACTSTTRAGWRGQRPRRHRRRRRAGRRRRRRLGGCPFAPGASGNLATEDLVHALEAMGIPTGIDLDALIEAAALACELVGRPVESHVGVAGPRFADRHRPVET